MLKTSPSVMIWQNELKLGRGGRAVYNLDLSLDAVFPFVECRCHSVTMVTPQGPHSHILMTGSPTEVHILYTKKSQL